ncbi:Retrovirus-related Pol polyprotein from transposon TNT 1-94 [Cardamine amara subsp. amara]|uniref:Retrovirus-related Pol polyprotein from transposon TNT 1-94 n=1 Tax=Cardamine amara subsp. amara TaxID=228776 RepID=A0ABD1B560_CARAN
MYYAMLEEEKLHRRGDYRLWKVRILARLGLLGLMEALKIEEEDGKRYVKIAEDEKLSANLSPGLEEKNRKARSMIILSVGDKFLRKIMKEDTAAGMLQVLEKLFMTTSFVRRLYLKQKLHSFKMNEAWSVMENIDEFQRLIDELSNAKVSVSDEDQATFLLLSLPKQFDELRDTLTCGKTSITVDEVIDAVLSKELELGSADRGYKNKCREKSKIRIEVEKFDGNGDYTLWKTRILAHFEILDLMEALKIGTGEGKSHSVALSPGLEEKKRKARSMIIQSVEDQDLRKKIMKENTAAGMFQILDTIYLSNRVYLKYKLCRFRMNESLSVEENIDEFERLVDDLSNANVSISDEDQAIRLLISLPERFDKLRDVLKYGRTSLTLDEVICAVLSEELLDFGFVYEESINTAEGLHVRGRSVTRDQNDRDRSKSKGKNGVCWICGEDGHYKNQCPDALMVSEANIMSEQDFKEKWVLDTGCTFHLTPRRDWFTDFHELDQGIVKMGNETVSEVKGIGTVRLQTSNGRVVVLTNVRYIPKFSRNLISVGTLESKGCSYHCENGVLKIKRGCKTVMEGVRYENLYFLQGSVETNHIEEGKDETNSCHSRLDQMSLKGIVLDNNKEVTNLEFCENYVLDNVRFGTTHTRKK